MELCVTLMHVSRYTSPPLWLYNNLKPNTSRNPAERKRNAGLIMSYILCGCGGHVYIGIVIWRTNKDSICPIDVLETIG